MAKVEAIVGGKGVSKFVRDVIRDALDQIAPSEEKAGPPYFEFDGGHEPRLSASGRALVFASLRKKKITLDELQRSFGIDDPVDFIYTLLGHRPLSNQASSVVIIEMFGRLYSRE